MKKKNEKEKEKQKKAIIFVITCLLMICLLILGGLRVILSMRDATIDSRIQEVEKASKENQKYKVAAWIKVFGTNIDYPVFEEPNVDITEEGKIDYVWEIGTLNKLNRINYIMGHNIMNLSSNPVVNDSEHRRFEQLLSYSYLDFAQKNQYIQFTVDGKDYLFKIFSVSFPGSIDQSKMNFDTYDNEDVKIEIENLKSLSIYNYDIDVNENDTIISLITCTRMFGDASRSFNVSARLVRDGESTGNYKVTKSEKYDEVEEKMKGEEEVNGQA